jgi:glycosyltransferase involved in cell wall biosynthesis
VTDHRVVMVGSFPPPVGGAALVNQMVLDALRADDVGVTPLDISGPALAHSRSLGYHANRMRANLRAARQARRLGQPANTLYIVPDAGAGAWYTAGLIRAAEAQYGTVVIHHHSCRYIENHSRPIAMLTERTRRRAIHVFLSDGMAAGFRARYGEVDSRIAGNARFAAEETAIPLTNVRAPGPLRMGHLSNLCAEKGFFLVADTFDAVIKAGIDASLLLAGPALDNQVTARIDDLKARHGARVRHLGAVRGQAKRDFYRDIDVFLFPTQFRQEAAPLVIYESLAAGVPVLATDRGVIAEVLGKNGAVCARDVDFATFALEHVRSMMASGETFASRAKRIRQHMVDACERSNLEYDALLSLLVTPTRRPQ